MRNIIWLTLSILLICSADAIGQGGTAFGVKAGPTVGFQSWSNSETELLFRYHGSLSVETYSEDAANALFAEVGYHVRGGAQRVRGGAFQLLNSTRIVNIATQTFPYEFRNVSLSLGAKQRFSPNSLGDFYYSLAIRGEYTLSDNLSDYHPENDPFAEFNLNHPFPGTNVRRWNYGISAGAGIEFMFSELVGGTVELKISPDISQQYFQQAFSFNSTLNGQQQVRTISERRIRNVSLELSIGFRFLRIVEYVNSVY